MGQFVTIRDGGKTSESGATRFLRQLSSNNQGPASSAAVAVTQHATPNLSVDIAVGDLYIAYQDYGFWAYNTDNPYNLAIAANNSGNDRIDAEVAYIDLAVVSSASNNNPNALKFMNVQGTPAGSPAAPDNTAIQAAVGAGNPFLLLRNARVNNLATTITNANLSNAPAPFVIGSNPKYLFYQPGILAIANDLAVDIIAPQNQTLTTLAAYAKTAPVGSSLTMRIYNITQNHEVGSISITAGSNQSSTTSLTNPSINAGDVLRLDCTAIGSGTPGSNVTVQAY